ncbi:c-type cytochrome [Sphingopyxis indica]|uniref:c-type cytochrome n=1 Tax=Sphingopyxis indica TaxID=436663 RepID=UPI0029392E03|nr:c-type cytochrome [Sphingopyxis indica]WOF42993.1 c-type cytochrome [Sphingopyxis indica]
MRQTWAVLFAAAALAGCSQSSPTDDRNLGGDPQLGALVADAKCTACHGGPGADGAPGVPSLSEQYPEYLKKQLVAFAAPPGAPNHRKSAVMAAIARSLSDDDRANVAAWYAEIWRKPSKARDPSRVKLGEQVFLHGRADDDLPACAACHRATATGIRPDFPNLAAQDPAYVENELRNWEQIRGHRGKLMSIIVPRLKPELAAAVADFVATQPSKPVR